MQVRTEEGKAPFLLYYYFSNKGWWERRTWLQLVNQWLTDNARFLAWRAQERYNIIKSKEKRKEKQAVNLAVLGYFAEVCKVGSISKAAEKLCISRQALSKAVAVLEGEFGTPLLLRSKSGVLPSPAGLALLRRAEVILAEYALAAKEVEALRQHAAEELRVGYGEMTFNLWKDGHAETFAREHAGLKVTCEVKTPDGLWEGLQNGELDLAVSSARSSAGEFAERLILHMPLFVLLCKEDPLTGEDEIGLPQLAGRTVCLGTGNSAFGRAVQNAFLREGVEAKFRSCESTNPVTIFRSVRASQGVYFTSALRLFFGGMAEGLTFRPFVPPAGGFPTKDIYAVARKETMERPVVRQYVRYLAAKRSQAGLPAV